MPKTRIILTIVGLTALALLATACSPSAAKLTGTGNEAFAQQAYEEALRSYQQAQAESPALAEPHYNAANVLYREGKYEEALKELQKAASLPQAEKVAQASLFNAGNLAYNTKSWEAAIESYRQALLRNPDDVDAKYNLELALQQQQQDQQNQDVYKRQGPGRSFYAQGARGLPQPGRGAHHHGPHDRRGPAHGHAGGQTGRYPASVSYTHLDVYKRQ